MKKKLSYYLISFFSAGSLIATPTDDEAREALKRVVGELPVLDNESSSLGKFFFKIIEFILSLGLLGRFVVGGLIAWTLFLIIRAVLRRVSFKRHEKFKAEEEQKSPSYLKHFYSKAVKAASGGDFSRAVVCLHNATVEYLYNASHLKRGRDYTNREICRQIKKTPFHQGFYDIALAAEGVLFNHRTLNKEEFEAFHELYRGKFL